MNKVAIRVENLSKLYRLGEVGTGTISHDLNRWWARMRGKEDPYAVVGQLNDRTQKKTINASTNKRINPFSKSESEYVYALKDINFEVQQGEVLGIIGKNGAGKSTLLKLLSKITAPSTGSIKARGRIASLLEVGTGMHPEMTGIENVYLNGTILGMTRREITDKLDDILDFAGCAKYADTPVKRYSSGMKVRLGFAVAAFLEPEILIVDEVLAVGDAEFQKRAIGKMQDISRGGGRTVLFVSHNMDSVRMLCSRSLSLKNGELDFIGDTEEAIVRYLTESNSVLGKQKVELEVSKQADKSVVVEQVEVVSADYPDNLLLNITDRLLFKVRYSVKNPLHKFYMSFGLRNEKGVAIINTWDCDFSEAPYENKEPGYYEALIELPAMYLNVGKYFVRVAFAQAHEGKHINKFEDVISFELKQGEVDIKKKGYGWGNPVLVPQLKWNTQKFEAHDHLAVK